MTTLLCTPLIILPAGLILACIHYALDRRAQRKRFERAVWWS